MTAPATDYEILITRILDAPRSLVFKVWTEPEHIGQWWLPVGFTRLACQLDLRVGGMFRIDMMAPDGSRQPCEGIYEEIVAPERIVYRGMSDDRHACGCGIPPYSRVTVSFTELGAQTRLDIRASLASEAARKDTTDAGFGPGWSHVLDVLERVLQQSSEL